MEHMVNIIDLSGESSSVEQIDKEVAAAVTASAPGRAAIARRKLFTKQKESTEKKKKESAEKTKDKRQLAKEFKDRLDNARKRPAPLETAKTRKNKRVKNKNVTSNEDVNKPNTRAGTKKGVSSSAQTATRRVTRSSQRSAAREAREKIASCSEEENREESEENREESEANRKDSRSAWFKVGARATGKWKGPECKGDWFEGVIVSIDEINKTVHIQYDDGDEDEDLAWSNLYLHRE